MGMNKGTTIIGTLLLALAVWSVMTWPLPVRSFSGMPSASYTDSEHREQYMIPGDHLQFLYHLWLARDTFFGPTPLFHNMYEFNTGDDAERRAFSTYYLPFSLVFSLGSLAGMAAGWNLTALVALWITALFTFLLARRYTQNRALCWLAAALGILLPYRWFTLCGGSPTGLGMMWPPVIFYGLDRWVRDKSWTGALLAGAGIYLAGWSDSHVFFFSALAAPGWCAVAWLYHRDHLRPRRNEWLPYMLSALPLAFFAALVIGQAVGMRSGLEDTALHDGGRSLHEVALFSPHLDGLMSADHGADSLQLYLGWPLVVIGLIGLGFYGRAPHRRRWKLHAGLLVLLVGIAGIILLSAGPNNPVSPRLWTGTVKLIPPYSMIRQPGKIYVLMPVFLAMAVVLLYGAVPVKNSILAALACAAAGAILLGDYQRLVRPRICLLEKQQGAYAAVADNARMLNRRAHIMALPLWPGDSHWSSLYQYYVARYRLRMVNGYRPTARQRYVNEIYLPFESFNKGGYGDNQLDELLKRGVHYLVLHENAFPEKVSPFAAGYTLSALLEHPRLRLLKQDGPVWAFEILDASDPAAVRKTDWVYHCPSRLWQAGPGNAEAVEEMTDDSASGGKYIRIYGPEARIKLPPYPMVHTGSLRFLIRCRGAGALRASVPGITEAETPIAVESANWQWFPVPLPAYDGYRGLPLELTCAGGAADVDVILPASGEWTELKPGERIAIPAPCFFHAGYTDAEKNAIVFRPKHDPADVIFYGPKMPLPRGRYVMELEYHADAPSGAIFGELTRRYPGPSPGPVPLKNGAPAAFFYEQDRNIRAALDFRYGGDYPVTIYSVSIRRLE